LNSFWRQRKKHISLSWRRRYHPFSLEPKSSACFWDKFRSRTGLLRSPCLNKWGSNEEQLASNVRSQPTLSPSSSPWFSSESELTSLNVRFSGGFGTGYVVQA
jgi:hypothetical protein